MDTEENQKQVFLGAHSPWKSQLRFPHSHRRDEAMEKWKAQNRAFPLSHSSNYFALDQWIQKGGPAAGLGSSFRLIVRLENALPHLRVSHNLRAF